MKIRSVRQIALKDIADYMRENNINVMDEHGDTYTVTTSYLHKNKEITVLNRRLGLHAINKK